MRRSRDIPHVVSPGQPAADTSPLEFDPQLGRAVELLKQRISGPDAA
jgi:hypothetical protein